MHFDEEHSMITCWLVHTDGPTFRWRNYRSFKGAASPLSAVHTNNHQVTHIRALSFSLLPLDSDTLFYFLIDLSPFQSMCQSTLISRLLYVRIKILVGLVCYSGQSKVMVSLLHILLNYALATCKAAAGQTYILLTYKLDLGSVHSTGYKQQATSTVILTDKE